MSNALVAKCSNLDSLARQHRRLDRIDAERVGASAQQRLEPPRLLLGRISRHRWHALDILAGGGDGAAAVPDDRAEERALRRAARPREGGPGAVRVGLGVDW